MSVYTSRYRLPVLPRVSLCEVGRVTIVHNQHGKRALDHAGRTGSTRLYDLNYTRPGRYLPSNISFVKPECTICSRLESELFEINPSKRGKRIVDNEVLSLAVFNMYTTGTKMNFERKIHITCTDRVLWFACRLRLTQGRVKSGGKDGGQEKKAPHCSKGEVK